MGNFYPAVFSQWFGQDAHLLNFSSNNENVIAQRKIQAFIFFRLFLSIKISFSFVFNYELYKDYNLSLLVIFLSLVLVVVPRFYLLGLSVILGISFYEFWKEWPFLINHQGLECAIIFLMFLIPTEKEHASFFPCSSMIKILMLSVWFFSGLHKLFDGYYLNGEFFALEFMFNDTTLGKNINYVFDLISVGSPATILLFFSWVTIILEIFLPISLLFDRSRALGIAGLFIFQTFVAYFSGEIDFAFTAFAILFLFIPRFAFFTYPSLIMLMIWVKPWI